MFFQVCKKLGITDHMWQEKHSPIAAAIDNLVMGFVTFWLALLNERLANIKKVYPVGAVGSNLLLDKAPWSSMTQSKRDVAPATQSLVFLQ